MKNSRKKIVLAFLNHNKPCTAKEIADFCYPITITSISKSLRTYYQQGLLKREKNQDGIYTYEITERGRERLEYLLGDKSIKTQIDLLAREPIRNLSKKSE